ncbi:MAG: hypothetical protein CW335_02480 [Clostridiales bacterium]|jgi:hypothetical protein|nr:hypothetical protein [Clostridiales bacterium]
MNYNLHISNLATPLLGEMTPQQSALLSLVVDAVREEIVSHLRPDADLTECEDITDLAAVLLTVSTMRQINNAELADFTAATLKVSFRDDHSALAKMAYRLLAPWFADGFAFRGVSG